MRLFAISEVSCNDKEISCLVYKALENAVLQCLLTPESQSHHSLLRASQKSRPLVENSPRVCSFGLYTSLHTISSLYMILPIRDF